jgi:hypothetical protein
MHRAADVSSSSAMRCDDWTMSILRAAARCHRSMPSLLPVGTIGARCRAAAMGKRKKSQTPVEKKISNCKVIAEDSS